MHVAMHSLLCNHCYAIFAMQSATIGAPFANQQILEFHCFGATGATIGAPVANQQILEFHCFGATEATIGAPFANQ